MEEGKVGIWVSPHHACTRNPPVVQGHLNCLGVRYDMVIGEDVTPRTDQDTGAQAGFDAVRLWCALVAEITFNQRVLEQGCTSGCHAPVRVDVHDRRRRAFHCRCIGKDLSIVPGVGRVQKPGRAEPDDNERQCQSYGGRLQQEYQCSTQVGHDLPKVAPPCAA